MFAGVGRMTASNVVPDLVAEATSVGDFRVLVQLRAVKVGFPGARDRAATGRQQRRGGIVEIGRQHCVDCAVRHCVVEKSAIDCITSVSRNCGVR